jgi:hypothetical protein
MESEGPVGAPICLSQELVCKAIEIRSITDTFLPGAT